MAQFKRLQITFFSCKLAVLNDLKLVKTNVLFALVDVCLKLRQKAGK